MGMGSIFAEVGGRDAALRRSIEVLDEVVALYDSLGLLVPAVHAATALQAVLAELGVDSVAALTAGIELSA